MNLSKKVFPIPAKLKEHGPARIIAMCNQKGGVGKTAAIVSLIEYYDFHSIPRVIIDCDMENKKAGSLKRFFPEAEKR